MAVLPSLSLGIHALALIIIYSAYGILQERIMKGHYGPDEERYTSAPILVLCNRGFAMLVGLAIVLLRPVFSRSTESLTRRVSILQQLKPASPIYAYAAVAGCNFAATFCQYQALAYVGFTTQALAKTAKMVPVLVIGRLVYQKKHQSRQWVAGWTVILGCATYLTSRPDPRALASTIDASGVSSFFNGICGTILLLGYLGFDGLTSTTQEKVFGKNPNSADPFGPDSPVLDQMVWVNLFASIIAAAGAVASFNTIGPSLRLLFTVPALMRDVTLLSATAAVGLIVLLNTIAAFGALTSSTIMTIRQFLSILVNAGVFGNFASVGLQGWLGVGWVASGIYIKMDRSWDEPKAKTGQVKLPLTPVDGSPHFEEKNGLMNAEAYEVDGLDKEQDDDFTAPAPIKKQQRLRPVRQYGPPLAVPVLLAAMLAAFLSRDAIFHSGASQLIQDNIASTLNANVADSDLAAAAGGEMEADTLTDTEAESLITAQAVNLSDPEEDEIEIEGGMWASELHKAVHPDCPTGKVNTTFYPEAIPSTVLATYPRSGNSYIRGLIERATTYRTSSVYCDKRLSDTFLGECNHNDPFLRKSHYPAVKVRPTAINTPLHYTQFDRALHVVRNPFDAVFSYWQYRTMHSHVLKANIPTFTHKDLPLLTTLAQRWQDHDTYWNTAPLLTHDVRYEDLRSTPLPTLMGVLTFLLPTDKLPSLKSLACVVELNEEAEAYHSRKSSSFASYSVYTPEIRQAILEIVKPGYCRHGYNALLKAAHPDAPMVDCTSIGQRTSAGLTPEKGKTKEKKSTKHSKRWLRALR